MSGVIGLSQLLLDTKLSPTQRKMAKAIHGSSGALLHIVDEILDFSKIEKGQIQLERVAFDLREVFEGVEALMESRAQTKGLELKTNLDGFNNPRFIGDPARLRQILLNLVNNAIKFTDEGGVTMRAIRKSTGDTVRLRIEVEDTGVGIPSDATQKIFHRYQQEDKSTSRVRGGTGLGLAISRQLIELMGGKIDVTSELNQGTTFHFEIDLKRAREQTPVSLSRPLPTAPGKGVRVLVVEDDATNRMVVEAQLKKLGCEVDVAMNGKTGLEKALKNQYDLVLMDCYLPVMDGFEATRLIRADPSGSRMPIVALTASVTKQDRRRCFDAGMNDCLAKPILVDKLRGTIDRWVHLRNTQRTTPPPANSDASTAVSILDPQSLAQLRILDADDPGFLEDVLGTYTKHLSPSIERLQQAATQGDLKAVQMVAHSLKGASRQVGALRLGHTLDTIEHQEDLSQVAVMIRQATEQAEHVRDELKRLLKTD